VLNQWVTCRGVLIGRIVNALFAAVVLDRGCLTDRVSPSSSSSSSSSVDSDHTPRIDQPLPLSHFTHTQTAQWSTTAPSRRRRPKTVRATDSSPFHSAYTMYIYVYTIDRSIDQATRTDPKTSYFRILHRTRHATRNRQKSKPNHGTTHTHTQALRIRPWSCALPQRQPLWRCRPPPKRGASDCLHSWIFFD
jgi:hypothetical protein